MTNRAANPFAGASSLVEVLRRRAVDQPDRLAYRFLAYGDAGEAEEATFTYAELERRARAIAAWLQERGAAGERVLLLYPASLDYVAAFYGCLLAGAVAVPAYPPRPNRPMPRIRAIVADAQARVALTTAAVFGTLERRIADLPDLAAMTWRTTDDLGDDVAESWRDPGADRGTLAFLQYTSGSTALPKGVMVTHGNLLHNESLIEAACGHSADTPCVSWLPLYHDLGLIGNMIQSLYVGTPCTLMAPVSFLQSPIRWLRAVSKYGGHTSGGPNFAYELCVAKTTPEQRAGLDLSSWRVAFNGAEPVRQETLERFAQTFAPHGFRPEAFFPCYGLAETTLIVTGPGKEAWHAHVPFRADELTRNRAVVAEAGDGNAREMVGCGRVLGDQQVAIVDPESRERCAPGGVGEIWVAGPSIARGYWNRPEETAETFGGQILGEAGNSYLRTGDLGFFHGAEGGELYITGRRKDLIIIRGSNHYPQDVELTVERGHPALRPGGGAAFSVEVDGEERLVVVQEIQREQRRADLGEIAAAVRKAVADEHEVQLWALAVIKPGALPKTSSGKVQRRQTKADFLAGAFAERAELVGEWREGSHSGAAGGGAAAGDGDTAAPAELATRADVERWLKVRLAGLAGLDAAGIDAGRAISDHGLDSLKAIELMHGIEERTGVSLPMESFFGGLTLAEVVDQVAAERLGAGPAEGLVREGEETGDHPLSDGQKALWFLWQLEPESAAYNLTAAVRVGGLGEGNSAVLAAAFQTLADRHAALRTSFVLDASRSSSWTEPAQRVHPVGTPVDFRAVDASAWSEEVLKAQLDEEAHRPFDLQSGPLLRVRIYERPGTNKLNVGEGLAPSRGGGGVEPQHPLENIESPEIDRTFPPTREGASPSPTTRKEPGKAPVLLVALHHIIGDFWSLAILARELGALMSGSALPALDLRYSDAVRWQRRMLAGAEGERLLAWWRERLAGELPVLDLPTDRPRPAVQTYRGSAVSFALGIEESARLRELGRSHQATLFMTLLAGFQSLLGRWSGQTDLLVGAPSAGRGRARLAGLVGYFVNPVVLRGDLRGEPAFGAFLDRVRGSVLGAFEHQDYPFPALVEHLQPERDPSRSPLFQVMFALQSAPSLEGGGKEQSLAAFAMGDETAEVQVGPLRLRHVPLPQRIAQFDLTLSMGEIGDGGDSRIAGTLDFNLDLFEPGTAARLAGSFQALLAAAAADPRRAVGELPLLSEIEQRQILIDWNVAAEELPAALSLVPDLFAAQAARVPEALAAVHGSERMTYRELDARSAAVASLLRTQGAGPETLVALCAERSLDLIAGLVGAMRAGAVYVPIDPEAPAERRSFLLADSGASILVTQRGLGLSWPEGIRTVFLDDSLDAADVSLPTLHPESGACLIYTSGSTGEPKGVLLEHRNLAVLVASFLASYAPGPGDAVLPLTSVASASFVGEVLPALASGAAVVLPDKNEMLDFAQLTGLIERAGVSILSTVPSMVAGLNALKDRLPKLRLLLSGGEALAAGDVDRLLDTAAVVNGYGLTETAVCSTIHRLEPADFSSGLPIPIGRPVMGHRLYVLDERLAPRPAGTPGELLIAGAGLARGYHRNPAATAERFLPDPFSAEGGRMYRTGDLALWRPDGVLDYLGRIDQQVKIRGFRIELGEIESILGLHPAVRECAVLVRDESGEKRLAAYVVFEDEAVSTADLLAYLREKLPDVMVPSAYVPLAALPLNANGKLNVAALPAPEPLRPELAAAFVAPRGEIERAVAEVWQEALKIEKVGVDDNFFDLGGHSLLMTRVHARLKEAVAPDLSLIDLFRYPTVRSLTRFLSPDLAEQERQSATRSVRPRLGTESRDIAVIGLGGRFPGARNPDQLWRNLVGGVESITRFSDEQLLAAGVDPDLIKDPNYIKAKGIVGDVDLFDAAFFGYNPRGAELTDPQHRVFLECAWEAMENAGYDTDRYPGRVGVFAGQSMNTYWLNNLYYHIDLVASVDSLQAAIGNDKDSLTTEVSYRMNLRGPSVLVQSSSSTSLTAIHYACQSLLAGECDMAITGGSSIHLPEVSGYLYHEGGTTDPDGHCRTFDADAKGFVSGHGVGAVVLKRLAEAQADGDQIFAVIKGSACNNDGSNKVSYMAPSVDGHADVVRAAQEAAGVAPDTISYMEAHGTGTLLGDPIEIAGLTQAFRDGTDKKQYCAIGSVKTNIGHLDTAAGVAGFMKTVLCLHHKTLPAILHFHAPNPKIDFANSPFFVNTELRPWDVPADFPPGTPRRAGVSSLGMGGTNTHVILEEAPAAEAEASGPSREHQLLPLSARTATALESQTLNLAAHLRETPDLSLADAAWTLQAGRRALSHRRIVVCRSAEEAVEVLESRDPEKVMDGWAQGGEKPVAFLFSGQGAQYVDMGLGLYETEEVFRAEIDRCAELLVPHLGFDLREVLYPGEGADPEEAARRLQQTAVTQPALFAVEYALAKLWMSWGVRPQAMLGHSIGEYAAACLAGVFKLEDALGLVAERGRLMQSMPPGSMLAVPLPEPEVTALLANHPEVSLATINRLDTCVVSGPAEAIAALERELAAREPGGALSGIEVRHLHTSHAFHSAMMDPILAEFTAAVARVERRAPRISYLSNVTGTWIRPEEATDPAYWARQLRGAVRFADGVAELLREPDRVLLEVGPGNTLATAARQHPGRSTSQAVVSSLRHPKEKHVDEAVLAASLGKLWLAGVDIDFAAYHAGERRLRVSLPTYSFERQRFWVEPKKPELAKKRESADLADWFHAPVWKQAPWSAAPAPETLVGEGIEWLLFLDGLGLGARLAARLRGLGARVTTVEAGEAFTRRGPEAYVLDPRRDDGYDALLSELDADSRSPRKIVHLWSVSGENEEADLVSTLDRGFHSLLGLARALARRGGEPAVDLLAVSSGVHEITGEEVLQPERATLLGPCKVIPREMPNVSCRAVDVAGRLPRNEAAVAALVDGLLGELSSAGNDYAIAYRGGARWVQHFEPVRMEEGVGKPRLRVGGVYLVTGGLGGIGLAVSEHLAARYRAKLVLIGRSGLPARDTWAEHLQTNGDDRLSRRIRHGIQKIQRLEELGGEALAVAADSADREALRRVKAEARARFGRVDGIFHAAGVPGMGLIQTKTRETAEAVLAPKVQGTLALADVFADQPLSFLALFSSVTAVLSQPGQADYSAANAFLDAFAYAENARGGPFTVSVDWDAWQEVGMAVETEVPEALRAWREESLRQGLSPAQGVDALERALRGALPQLALSRRDFQTRIEESYASHGLEELAEAAGGAAREAHARPALSSAFVPPRSEAEQKIAAIWEEILGIDKVGVHDNFFDLGGNSLIGLKVISRVKAEFQADISAVTLFEGPTVSALARLVQAPAAGDEEQAPVFEDRRSRGAMRREKLRNRRG